MSSPHQAYDPPLALRSLGVKEADERFLAIYQYADEANGILQRLILEGGHLSDLMAPLDLGWKVRDQAETALMAELIPLLTKRAQGREISRQSAYA